MKTLTSYALTMAIAATIFGCAGARKITSTSEWQSKPVTVDGNADDWQLPLRWANADTKLNYSISNDGEKLYFCIMTEDPRAQLKIMYGGLQIRVDLPGKDDTPVTLLYPIPGSIAFPKESKPKSGGAAEPAPKLNKQQLLMEASTLQASGFPFAKETTELPLLNKYGANIAATFGADERIVYEASIPLKDLNLEDKDIDVTITLKGLPRSKMPKSQNNSAAGAGGMGYSGSGAWQGGGRMSGAYGGNRMYGAGYGPSYNSSYSAAFTDQKLSLSMRLAKQ